MRQENRIGGGGLRHEEPYINETICVRKCCVNCNWSKENDIFTTIQIPETLTTKNHIKPPEQCPECAGPLREMKGQERIQVVWSGTKRMVNTLEFIRQEDEKHKAQKHELLNENGKYGRYQIWCHQVKEWALKHNITLAQAINILIDVHQNELLSWVEANDFVLVYRNTLDAGVARR